MVVARTAIITTEAVGIAHISKQQPPGRAMQDLVIS
jgi:hypothetical protein